MTIKTFIIPALFVVRADSQQAAEEIAGDAQSAAGQASSAWLFMDEELPTIEADIGEDDELPHSIKPYVPTDKQEIERLYGKLAKAHAVALRLGDLARNPTPSVIAIRECADTLIGL